MITIIAIFIWAIWAFILFYAGFTIGEKRSKEYYDKKSTELVELRDLQIKRLKEEVAFLSSILERSTPKKSEKINKKK